MLSKADLVARMKSLGYSVKEINKVAGGIAAKKLPVNKEDAAFKHVSTEERDAMKKMHDDGMGVKKIAATLGRSTDTVSKHVFHKNKCKTAAVGRPIAISEVLFRRIQKVYQKLLRESQGKEVTAAMVKHKMKLKCSLKTLSRAFWAHGIHFRPLYEKPDLSAADVKARREWAEEHRRRSHAQWNKYLHAVIDNKTFQVYHTGKARDYAARRQVRGAYRARQRVFAPGYTKPPSTLIQNTGAKSATVTCAIGNGKVLMWHVTPGRWNGEAARQMYSGPLRRALEKEYPNVRGNWRVLEDNDPSGYKSTKGLAAKAETGITTLDLPKRSPDLNPLDFSFWAMVNKKMRKTEAKWPKAKRETRAAYLARLKRTAQSMSSQYITNIVGALAGRVQQVIEAGGSYFPEGGNT